jgi:hypothetical protein
MLMGMPGGFMKFCFLYLWNSRCTDVHYNKMTGNQGRPMNWENSVHHIPFINPMKISLPPPYIKLGLTECLVKAMAKTHSQGLQYLAKNVNKISNAKLREGIFMGPQIQEILED